MDGLSYQNSLRPRQLVDVLDATFRIYRRNFLTFIGVAAIVTVSATLLERATQTEQPAPEYPFGYYEGQTATETPVLVSIVGVLVQIVVTGSVISYSASEISLGREPSFIESFRKASRRFFPVTLGVIAIGIASFLLGVLAETAGSICVPITAILMLSVVYFLGCMSVYAVPTITLERVGFLLGLRRAMALAKQRFWRNFWFVIDILVIWWVIVITFGQFAEFVLGSSTHGDMLIKVIDLAIEIFTIPILPIGLTLMYYDTRIRVEGLDLALMAVEAPDPRPSDVPSPVAAYSFLTSQDVRNILILALGIFAIGCGLYMLLLMLLSY
jgi:hypothetical protein